MYKGSKLLHKYSHDMNNATIDISLIKGEFWLNIKFYEKVLKTKCRDIQIQNYILVFVWFENVKCWIPHTKMNLDKVQYEQNTNYKLRHFPYYY